jgi:hypothetical protein
MRSMSVNGFNKKEYIKVESMFIMFFALFLFIGVATAVNMDSFEDIMFEVGNTSRVVFHHESTTPSDQEGVLFFPASSDLQNYLSIDENDPYALVNMTSEQQFNTYSWENGGVKSRKVFEQPSGVHPEFGLSYTDLEDFTPGTGLHVFLIFSNASASVSFANIVNNISHPNVTKHCFDLTASDLSFPLVADPAIGVFSTLFNHLIEIRSPVSQEFVDQVLVDTMRWINLRDLVE